MQYKVAVKLLWFEADYRSLQAYWILNIAQLDILFRYQYNGIELFPFRDGLFGLFLVHILIGWMKNMH